MPDQFFFVGLPYLSIVIMIIGTIIRFKYFPLSVSSQSSQFLENDKIFWGSFPWHIGIGVIFIGHLTAFLFPGFLQALTSNRITLYSIEVIGLICSVLAFFGLIVLFIRRMMNPRIQAVTHVMDIIILILLAIQILLGILTAVLYPWGSSWSTQTLTPYMWSLIFLNPDLSAISNMPMVIKLHLIFAWIIFLLVPFSRLIHAFSLPLEYLIRLPQIVIYNSRRPQPLVQQQVSQQETRRKFIKAGVGLTAGTGIFAIGVMDKLLAFLKGPEITDDIRSQQLGKSVDKLKNELNRKQLELERINSQFIFVANLKDLKSDEGFYFTDFSMGTSMAFIDENGMPYFLNARCPHLGCTVGNKATQGKLLCPCHVSHFDVKSGKNLDGPAQSPLDRLQPIIMDENLKIVVNYQQEKRDFYKVYISKGNQV